MAVVIGIGMGAAGVNRTRQSGARHLLAILLAMAVWSCGGAPENDVSPEPYDLVEALPKATVQTPHADHVASRIAVLRGEQQRGIFMHPDSRAEFPPVKLGKASVLSFAIGLDDSVRDKPGDGVDFTVSVRQPDGYIVEVWSKYLDSRKNEMDGGWHNVRVSLEKYSGLTISIILSTSITDDSQFDWAYWGKPTLTTGVR
jgi:hypothetical protein